MTFADGIGRVVPEQEGNDLSECAAGRCAGLLCRRFQLRSRGLVREANTFRETGSGFPSESMHPAYIEQLLRCAIRTRCIENDLAIEFENLCDQLCQCSNREILAGANVDQGASWQLIRRPNWDSGRFRR